MRCGKNACIDRKAQLGAGLAPWKTNALSTKKFYLWRCGRYFAAAKKHMIIALFSTASKAPVVFQQMLNARIPAIISHLQFVSFLPRSQR